MFKVKAPHDKNTLSQQLKVRHRNSYEISILLEHLKHTKKRSHLDNSSDTALQAETLLRGRVPIWIERGRQVPDLQVLEHIKEACIPEHESVTLIHNKKELAHDIKSWCEGNNWRHVNNEDIIGCEDESVVIFDDILSFENVSRGRKGIVIVSTQG